MREFLVFNSLFFKKVRGHLVSCTTCDPDEALEVYIDRLKNPPTMASPTSAGTSVIKGFQSLEKAMKKARRPISPALLNEAYLMSRDANVILERANHCSITELVRCYRYHEARCELLRQLCGRNKTFAVLQQILRGGGQVPPEDELQRLVEVSDVMLS